MDIGVGLFDIPFDRSSFAPQKLCTGRKAVVVEPVGRGTKQSRIRARAIRAIDTRTDRRSVPDVDLNNFIDHFHRPPAQNSVSTGCIKLSRLTVRASRTDSNGGRHPNPMTTMPLHPRAKTKVAA